MTAIDAWRGTPGPWTLTERAGYYEILAPCADADWYGVPKTHAIAYADTEIDETEQLANAALITAAPDLIEAAPDAADILERYADFIRTLHSDEFERHPYLPLIEETAERLRAAIAKALHGGSNG